MSALRDVVAEQLDQVLEAAGQNGWAVQRARLLGQGIVPRGIQRMVDIHLSWHMKRTLEEINLNRWNRYDPAVAQALREARVAVNRLSSALWAASNRASVGSHR